MSEAVASAAEHEGAPATSEPETFVVAPFAAIIPLRRPAWIWALYLRAVFLVRFFPRLFFSEVHRLGTVLAMRWVLLPPFARDVRAGRPPDRQYHLMFETNFAGDAFAYVENFARVLKPGMKLLFRPALGYPGLEDPAEFTRFALKFDTEPDRYYCAYRGHDAIAIQQALLLSRTGGAAWVRSEPEFVDGEPIPMRRAGQRSSPKWATIVLRVKAERASALRRHLAPDGPGSPSARGESGAPFENLGRVHFGRIMVVDTPSGPYLVLTLTFDAVGRFRRRTAPVTRHRWSRRRAADIALADLVAENFDALDAILQHCHGYTSVEVPEDRRQRSMLGFLVANQKDRHFSQLPYCAYPEATVSEITRALSWLRGK